VKAKKAALAAVVAMCFSVAGCNAYQTAQKAHDIVEAVVAVAQADLPNLAATGVFTSTEQAAVTNYLSPAVNLNGQLSDLHQQREPSHAGKDGEVSGIVGHVRGGMSDLKELAQLRVMNPNPRRSSSFRASSRRWEGRLGQHEMLLMYIMLLKGELRVNQRIEVTWGQGKAVAVRDGIGGTGLHAIAAEDAP
jgi:predicted small secreted protein